MMLTHQQRSLERLIDKKHQYACDFKGLDYADSIALRYLKSWKNKYGHIGSNGLFADMLISVFSFPL